MNLHIVSSPATKENPESNSGIAIRLENVTVKYNAPSERISTFKEYAIRWLQRKVHHNTFLALNDVSLTIKQGLVYGFIGQNGAGKSTLLKVIARVLRPTTGRVWVKGRVAPLLELGAGFHPELSGRENVFLNGAILGFTRSEMEAKLPGIIEFSELGDFIEAPVRTYSSGMTARLGFAVATDTQPNILILDEVLSVGDEAFQKKCNYRIKSIQDTGATILIVSHSTPQLEAMCSEIVWLEHGKVKMQGNASEVAQCYRDSQVLR